MLTVQKSESIGKLASAMQKGGAGLGDSTFASLANGMGVVAENLKKAAQRLEVKSLVLETLERTHGLLMSEHRYKDFPELAVRNPDMAFGMRKFGHSDAEARAFRILERLLCRNSDTFVVHVDRGGDICATKAIIIRRAGVDQISASHSLADPAVTTVTPVLTK